MAKEQLNARISALTRRQLDELGGRWGTSQTETLTVIIDRMHREEMRAMRTYTVTNERYSSEPVTATVADLEQLAAENGWDAEFTETIRNGKSVVIDQRNEIVAEAE